MSGIKINITLAMPTDRPSGVSVCDECSMKHAQEDECWDGLLPAGELELPPREKTDTGREMIDTDPGSEKKPKKERK